MSTHHSHVDFSETAGKGFGRLPTTSHVEKASPPRFARDAVSGTTVFYRNQEVEAVIEKGYSATFKIKFFATFSTEESTELFPMSGQ